MPYGAPGFRLSPMRLDMFLKVSRLVKRRSVANELCDKGAVLVGGAAAKAGRVVKPGDVITLRLPRRRLVVEVAEAPQSKGVPKDRAAELYRVIEDVIKKEEFF